MIVKTIERYSAPVWQSHYPHAHVPHHARTQLAVIVNDRLSHPNEMSKMEYALFIKNLPYQKGDLVASLHSTKPYHHRGVFRVKDIDEIHRFVDWGNSAVGPICVELESLPAGVMTFKGGAKAYRKVEWADVPVMWRDKIAQQALERNV